MKTIKEQMQEAEQFARDNLRALCREAVDKTHGSTNLPLTVQLRNMIPIFGITPIMLADEMVRFAALEAVAKGTV